MLRAVFMRWWLSNFLASFGDGLRLAAFPLLAASITRSPTAIAAVVAVQGVPWLLVGPAAGVLADRHAPRRVLVSVQLLQAVAVCGLAAAVITRTDDLAVVFVSALLTGTAATLRDIATQTGTPRLVDDADLDRANGRLSAGSLVGNELLGPAGGGLLFGIAAALPFALNGGAIGLAVLLVLTLPTIGARPARPAAEEASTVTGELRDGLRWVRGNREIRALITAVGVVATADAAWFAVLVLYVTRVLHHAAADYGALLAVGAVGGIAASSACGWLTRRLGGSRLLVLSVIAMAGGQLVLGLTANVLLAAAMLALSSGAFGIFNVVAVGIRQRRVPAHVFGRVTSLYLAVGGGAEALGALVGGLIASTAGVRAPMLIGVVPLLGVAAGLVLVGRRPAGD